MALNVIVLQGRLTADPEMRRTQSGTAVANFVLAVDRDRYSKDAEKVADFIPCVAWKESAEFVCKWFHKGDPAIVNGQLQSQNWTDNDGKKRTSLEVKIDRMRFLPRSKDSGSFESGSVEASALPATSADDFQNVDVPDEELPF